MESFKRNSKLIPILVLFFLSPVIAELLFASTPVSRASQLIFESTMYGSGALLIREFARRYKLGWMSIILAGVAYGVIEECLALQSAFNPVFIGNDLGFGRTWGVNWVWCEYIIGYHAIWSITIPILVTELLFPIHRNENWLNNTGIVIMSVLYLLSCLAFYAAFYHLSAFSTTAIHYVIAGLIALGLILLALYLPVGSKSLLNLKTPSALVVGLISFAGSSFWLVLFSLLFKPGPGLIPWLIEIAGLFIAVVLTLLISAWSKQNWNDNYSLSLVFGAIMASMLFGLYVLYQTQNRLDQVCQVILIFVTILLLGLLKRSILSRIKA